MPFSNIIIQALVSLVIVGNIIALQSLWAYFHSPLKNFPGPFAAKFTNLWRFFDTYGGRPELTQRLLHEKYGSAVRIGPNTISLSDPKLIRTLYNTRGDFLKSKYYTLNDTKIGRKIISNVFSTLSNEFHSEQLRPIQKFYKMSSLLPTEPLVDQTILSFIQKLDDEFVLGKNAEKTCTMDEWLMFFAWDVIAQLTFSRPMGFIEAGGDQAGFLTTANKALDYFATIGQMPFLDKLLAKNPVYPIGPPSWNDAAGFCAQQNIARQQKLSKGDFKESGQRDMLDDFLEAKRHYPEIFDDSSIVGALLVNVLAGADTTGILLRAIIYYVLKNPRVHRKLQKELDEVGLSIPVSYVADSKLNYLDAVIKEACRVHPGVGLLLERVVPESGLTLPDGRFLPQGTTVGMNAWIVHQNKAIFGQDAESFNPDRWLKNIEEGETVEEWQERVQRMKAADLTFGAGNRVCLGKNISILETYKVIPSLFLVYDMSFVDPDNEWNVRNSWFVRQSGIDIKIRRRAA